MTPVHPVIHIAQASSAQRDDAARILREAIRNAKVSWPTHGDAREEVDACLESGRTAFLALDGDVVTGWIGAIVVSPWLWELHPLAVDPAYQNHGIGTTLVETLERAAREAGVTTLYLGTDDDWGGTNLYGRELYPDVLAAAQLLRATQRHAFRFYEKMGYTVTGIIPDASGPGKPDIIMAKRLA
jgi:aminoglycoside 6'-N-acetyltransferase I